MFYFYFYFDFILCVGSLGSDCGEGRNVAYIGYIPLDLYSRVTVEEIGETCGLRSALQAYWRGVKSLFGGAEL